MNTGSRHDEPSAPARLVRTPESPLTRPRNFARTVWLDLRLSRPLTMAILRRDLRAEHRASLVGIPGLGLPLAVMAAAAIGFEHAGVLRVSGLAVPYGVYVVSGLVLWTTFVEALQAPVAALASEHRLLIRTSAPVEAIVLARVGELAVHLAVRGVVLLATLVYYGVRPASTILLAPLPVAGLVAFGIGLGLFMAPLNLVYRDVSRLLTTVTVGWLLFSPVYYAAPAAGIVGTIVRVNPVTPLVEVARQLAFTGGANAGTIALVLVAPMALATVGWMYLRVAVPIALEQASG